MSTILSANIADAIATLQDLKAFEPQLGQAASLVRAALLGGKKLLVAGNGGSAGDGADFATEFACRFVGDRRPWPAINLAACGSLMTATANDYGYEQSFARPVRAFGSEGDVLVVLTTSGNSPNILRAMEQARAIGMSTIAMLGKDGGAAKGLATVEFIIPSRITARIQEAHRFLLHTLCETVEPDLAGE
jgi:D-sedoheptulose 7-phosphate isomerase